MQNCPTIEQLERWLRDAELGDEALAAHIDECSHCQQTLETLTVNPNATQRQRLPKPAMTVDDPVLGKLKAALPTRDAGRRPSANEAPGRALTVLKPVQPQSRGPGAPSQWEEEIRALLQRRLRVYSLISALVFVTFEFLYLRVASPVYVRYTDWGGAFLLPTALLVSLGCAAVLWVRKSLTLTSLRAIELLLFGVAAVCFAKYRYTALVRSADGPWEGPAHRDMFLMQVMLINNTLWNFMILCYGVFIPNTWQRCIVVVALLALPPILITVASGLVQPAVSARIGFLLSFTVLGLLVSAALATFGSFKISTLQGEAFAARQLGQYRLKERLGAGAMGEIYLAEHRLLKRPCAIKLIRPEQGSDPKLLSRFQREVQATARLSHPNTVEIYDYGHTEDGTFYYVMEYLAGLNLEDLVARYGPVPAPRAVHFLRQLCGALREAHAAGLVHRDIKPSNIIACCHGGRYDVVKLLDFGLVRSVGSEKSEARRLTKEGLILGTPDFMSPEQANGTVTLDARSDLYSMGALAYFLLTGKPPFPDRTVLETLIAHLHQPPVRLTDLCPQVPTDLEAVVLRCLAKEPAGRPASADELDKALLGCALAETWTEAMAREWWASSGLPGGTCHAV